MVLVFTFAAILVASATGFTALLMGAPFASAFLLYCLSGSATLLGLPLLAMFLRAESRVVQEIRLLEHHPG